MLIELPENFRPSEKFKNGITNCAKILQQVDIEEIKSLEAEINSIGPNPEKLHEWIDQLYKAERFVLVTAALATFYTQIELRK